MIKELEPINGMYKFYNICWKIALINKIVTNINYHTLNIDNIKINSNRYK